MISKRCLDKPPIGTRIDRSHPLSNGLLLCYLFNDGPGRKTTDIFNVAPVDDWYTSSYPVWSNYGLDFESSTTQFATCNGPNIPAIGTSQFTMHIVLINESFNLNGCGLVTFGSYDPAFGQDSTGLFYVYHGGFLTKTTVAATIGKVCSTTFVRKSTGANGFEQYVNGSFNNSQTYNGSIAKPATLSLATDRDGAAIYHFDGTIVCIFLYLRALSGTEVGSLTSDPYQMFMRPKFSRLYIPSAPSGDWPRRNPFSRPFSGPLGGPL